MQTAYRNSIVLIPCILLMLLSSFGVMAQPKNGTEMSVAASVLHFGYQEFDDNGILLDREDGNIPGFTVGVSHASDRWVFGGDFAFHGGDVAYEGQTNTNPPVPISTRTVENIAEIAARGEYWINPRYAHYLGAGYRYWSRDIRPTTTASGAPVSGLLEYYTWWTLNIGAKIVMYESGSDSWLLDVSLVRTVNPTISVKFNSQYDDISLPLGERWGGRLSLPWRHAFNRSASLNIEPYVESYEFGRSANAPITSNGTVVGTVFEPYSKTLNYGVHIGIAHHF